MNGPSPEMIELFLQEASEHLQFLREYSGILQDPYPLYEDIERLYISAHGVAGTGGTYGYELFNEVASKLAHIFQYAMNATISPEATAPLVEFIYEAIAVLESDLIMISANGVESVEDIAAFKQRYPFAFQGPPPAADAPTEQPHAAVRRLSLHVSGRRPRLRRSIPLSSTAPVRWQPAAAASGRPLHQASPRRPATTLGFRRERAGAGARWRDSGRGAGVLHPRGRGAPAGDHRLSAGAGGEPERRGHSPPFPLHAYHQGIGRAGGLAAHRHHRASRRRPGGTAARRRTEAERNHHRPLSGIGRCAQETDLPAVGGRGQLPACGAHPDRAAGPALRPPRWRRPPRSRLPYVPLLQSSRCATAAPAASRPQLRQRRCSSPASSRRSTAAFTRRHSRRHRSSPSRRHAGQGRR